MLCLHRRAEHEERVDGAAGAGAREPPVGDVGGRLAGAAGARRAAGDADAAAQARLAGRAPAHRARRRLRALPRCVSLSLSLSSSCLSCSLVLPACLCLPTYASCASRPLSLSLSLIPAGRVRLLYSYCCLSCLRRAPLVARSFALAFFASCLS